MPHFRPCRNDSCRNLVDKDSLKKYCCNACRQQAYRRRYHTAHKRQRSFTELFCRNCGKPFLTYLERQQFCKVSCRSSFHQQQKRLMLKAAHVLVNP